LLAQQAGPLRGLARDVLEPQALDHAQRIDVRERVVFALRERPDQLHGDVRERDDFLRPLAQSHASANKRIVVIFWAAVD
jgi:hypothetical protein